MTENPDDQGFEAYMQLKKEEWEALCLHCGACCGAFDDPCRHLIKDAGGTYACDSYAERFGVQETVKGKKFRCLPIRDILSLSWDHDHLCNYKKHFPNL